MAEGKEIELDNLAENKEEDAAADDDYETFFVDDADDRLDRLRQNVQEPEPLLQVPEPLLQVPEPLLKVDYETLATNMNVDNFYSYLENNLGQVRTKPINYENFSRKKSGLWYTTNEGKSVRLTWAKDPSRFLGLSSIISEANRAGVGGSQFIMQELGRDNRSSFGRQRTRTIVVDRG